jgi:hypothetical protein
VPIILGLLKQFGLELEVGFLGGHALELHGVLQILGDHLHCGYQERGGSPPRKPAPNPICLPLSRFNGINMPRGPKGEHRPADVASNGVKVMRIASGEEPEDFGPRAKSQGKDPAAVALGRKGGKARAAAMSKKRRKEIAIQAAEIRWKNRDRE